jgi:hypothetical protein
MASKSGLHASMAAGSPLLPRLLSACAWPSTKDLTNRHDYFDRSFHIRTRASCRAVSILDSAITVTSISVITLTALVGRNPAQQLQRVRLAFDDPDEALRRLLHHY